MPDRDVTSSTASTAQASAVAVIPARFASTRFPGKMLAAQTGRPLVQHVVDQVRRCRLIQDVMVAADDERIAAALSPFGTRVVMTSPAHASGTDRVAEVARSLSAPIILNVQCDEPEIEPAAIDALIELMQRTPAAEMATLAAPFPAHADPNDPNLVKVVLGRDGRALYFSRSRIPYPREAGQGDRPLLHIGMYGYRREFLLQLAGYGPSPLELTEKLEQLRVLEYGHSIYAVVVDCGSHGIDTPQQYADFVKRAKARAPADPGVTQVAAVQTRVPRVT